jgi:hypothetical protein
MNGYGTLIAQTGLNGDSTTPAFRTDQRDPQSHVPVAVTITGTVAGVDLLGQVTPQDTPVVIHTFTANGGINATKFPLLSVRVRGASNAGVRVSVATGLTPLVAANFSR